MWCALIPWVSYEQAYLLQRRDLLHLLLAASTVFYLDISFKVDHILKYTSFYLQIDFPVFGMSSKMTLSVANCKFHQNIPLQ